MIEQKLRKIMYATILCTVASSAFAVAPKHGWLKTEGPYLLNEKGNIVQLKGMSFFWSTPAWPGAKYYNASTVNTLVNDWKCTVLRAAYDRNENGNNGGDLVNTVIEACIDKGIYVIIDWHSHTAHNSADAASAISYFTEKATQYKNTPNVIFEVYNEPVVAGDAVANDGSTTNAAKTWKGIKPYLTNVTKAIRGTGSKNLVILGTPYYCQHVGVAASDPVVDDNGQPFENVAYAFHFYAASHGKNAYYVESQGGGMEDTYMKAGMGKIPIFVTEWGTTHRDGGEGGTNTYIDEKNTAWWFDNILNSEYHISHCNWSVSDFQASSCFSSGTSPSQSGTIVKKYTSATEDEWAPAWKTGLVGPAGDSVFDIPVEYHQASRFNRFYSTHAESASVPYSSRDKVDRRIPGIAGYTALKITPSESECWVTYFMNVTTATKNIILRAYNGDGTGTVEFYVNENKAGSIELKASTTWQSVITPVDLPAGKDTLKLKFVNTAGTAYYIEWLEPTNATDVSTATRRQIITCTAPSLTTTRHGFVADFNHNHGFSLYTITSVDGRVIEQGTVNQGAHRFTSGVLPPGLWILKLSGTGETKLYKTIVYDK